MNELKTLIEAIGVGFQNFKGTNDERIKLIETQTKALETAVARAGMPGGWAANYPSEAIPTASGRWAVDIQGRKIPVLARGERMSASFPKPSGAVDWSIGEFVKSSMGIQASVLERGVSTVPLYIGSQIIDMVREKARILQAGALTIPLPDGPMNLCRIVSDPVVSEHTEAADDIIESIPVFTPVSLDPKTLAVLIPLSLEIVQDSPNIDAALRQSISSAFALKVDQLGIAAILADTNIPDSAASQATDAWSGTLAAVGSMLALNQGLPKAIICGPGDYIARAGELASTAGSWLGAPPVLKDMLDLESSGMTDGFAILGNFELGVGLAVRQSLTLEMVRWGKPGYGSHILVAFARMGIYVLQPNHLYNQVDTVGI